MMKAVNAGILVCAAMLTNACGIKGPLYLPNVPRDAPWPYKTDKPAPAASQAPASPPPASSTPATPPPASDSSGATTTTAPAPETK
jgi:predicted small lipoprotein YifL